MDRISDSGSEDMGSNPVGVAAKRRRRRDEKFIPMSEAIEGNPVGVAKAERETERERSFCSAFSSLSLSLSI